MKDIVIIGAGGFGREVQWLIEEINNHSTEWNLLGFIDDNIHVGTIINEKTVLGNTDWFKGKKIYAVCAIADPTIKRNVINRLNPLEVKFPVLIHPNVRKSRFVDIGEGSIICSGVIITVNVIIGKHVIVNVDTTIGHDAELRDYTTILPSVNVSGHVIIDELSIIGTGCQIIQNILIGKNSSIGAGAVVVSNIPDNVVAVGIPAKVIKNINLL